MLTVWGSSRRFCDGVNRRDFVRVGALGTGLTLADLMRQRALGANRAPASIQVLNGERLPDRLPCFSSADAGLVESIASCGEQASA